MTSVRPSLHSSLGAFTFPTKPGPSASSTSFPAFPGHAQRTSPATAVTSISQHPHRRPSSPTPAPSTMFSLAHSPDGPSQAPGTAFSRPLVHANRVASPSFGAPVSSPVTFSSLTTQPNPPKASLVLKNPTQSGRSASCPDTSSPFPIPLSARGPPRTSSILTPRSNSVMEGSQDIPLTARARLDSSCSSDGLSSLNSSIGSFRSVSSSSSLSRHNSEVGDFLPKTFSFGTPTTNPSAPFGSFRFPSNVGVTPKINNGVSLSTPRAMAPTTSVITPTITPVAAPVQPQIRKAQSFSMAPTNKPNNANPGNGSNGITPEQWLVNRTRARSVQLEERVPTVTVSRKEVEQLGECAICMEVDIDSQFTPCGHFVSCYKCGKGCKECPICRVKATCARLIIS